jgi:aryl-alcohol dehydrogenase-like predicted oxidoreductase
VVRPSVRKEPTVIEGSATPEGTRETADKYDSLEYIELDHTGLMVSPAGFGCYRVDTGIDEHERALSKALLGGINLIDTSSNYGDGGSEVLVGEVLEKLIRSARLSRESVVVVSKVGYLQGQNYLLSQERKRHGKPFKELVLYGEGLEHCIQPEFLQDQLNRSLERLKLKTLDFYLLHNPEYYLMWAGKMNVPLEEARATYYNRIKNAFQHLENEVEKGRIRYYGISSNTFPASTIDPHFTSLERVRQIAESLSPKHHFHLVQLPMNLFETGGVTEKNQAGDRSVIQFAHQENIGVLINRPLNAILGNTLTRLADVPTGPIASGDEIEALIEELIGSEEHLRHEVMPSLDLTSVLQERILEQIAVGQSLRQHWRNLGTYDRWHELQSSFLFPRIQGVFQFLTQNQGSAVQVASWMESHQKKVGAACAAIASAYQKTAAEQSAQIKARVSSIDGDWADASTLSQMAIRALRSTVGVTTVLVGMRREAYVDDVLRELSRPVNRNHKTESWRQLLQS